jgi:tetratricopeptide (TPR) repeat protein
MAPPISIKLRCNSWKQLAALYKRDLARSAVFLKSSAPPPLETPVRIHLTLPNRELVVLDGVVYQHVPPGGLNGRGPGVDIKLPEIPAPAMAKIQAALESPDRDEGKAAAGEREDGDGQESGAPASPAEQAAQPAHADAPQTAPETAPETTNDTTSETANDTALAGAPRSPRGPQRTPAPAADNPFASLLADGEDLLGDLAPPAGGAQAQPASPPEDMTAIHEAAERVARLEQERESLRKLNAFQILGVGYETTDEAVHEAFASLSQRYHPDRFAGEENEAARDIAVEIFALIRAAHRLLENSNSRERLRRELNRAERGADGAAPKGDTGSAPASPQEEIPTKPVLVAEDGTRVAELGVPASPQDEIPTKPSPVSENAAGDQATAKPATPPPIPKARPAAPPPIPKARPAAPPPIPKREPVKQDEDVIPVDDLGILEVEPSAPAIPIPEAAATPPAAATALDEELGAALQPVGDGPLVPETPPPTEDIAPPVEQAEPPVEQAESPVEQAAAAEPAAAEPSAVADTPEPAAAATASGAAAADAAAQDAASAEDRAAEEAVQAVAADPSALGMASAPQFAEAIALLAAGKYSEAASVYRVARRRDPDDVAAKVGLELCEGLKALANRDKLEAAQRFEAALELDPDNRRAASELAEMRRQAALQRKANLSRLRDQIE